VLKHPSLLPTTQDHIFMSDQKVADIENGNGGLHRQMTTVTLSPEQFEMLYMQPKTAGAGANASRVGNPTPWGVAVFILATWPLSMTLLNFQGADSQSSLAELGTFYGAAGIGLYITAVMEWICGNTFPMVVFGTFGGFWVSYAILITPSFGIAPSFAPALSANATAAAAAGQMTRSYTTGVALYLLVWGLITAVFFVCSLRTNVPFVLIFISVTFVFELLAAGYFHIGVGNFERATMELKVAGGFGFLVAINAFWVFIHVMLAAVDFPYNVPLFDLSHIIKGKEKMS